MNVWLLETGERDYEWPVCVYSSLEAAKASVEAFVSARFTRFVWAWEEWNGRWLYRQKAAYLEAEHSDFQLYPLVLDPSALCGEGSETANSILVNQ